jgi:hypothetical protein
LLFHFLKTDVTIQRDLFISLFFQSMKKGIAIGLLTVASIALFGCQQKPVTPVTPAVPEKATTTATVNITPANNTTTTKASLEILPATQQAGTTMQVKPKASEVTGTMETVKKVTTK